MSHIVSHYVSHSGHVSQNFGAGAASTTPAPTESSEPIQTQRSLPSLPRLIFLGNHQHPRITYLPNLDPDTTRSLPVDTMLLGLDALLVLVQRLVILIEQLPRVCKLAISVRSETFNCGLPCLRSESWTAARASGIEKG